VSEDLLPHFIVEGRELVERARDALSDLERGAAPAPALEQALRAIHTLKGSAGLFDMQELGDLLHAAEDALTAARGRGAAPPELAALIACVGEAEHWIEALDVEGKVSPDRRKAAAALEARLRTGAPAAPAREPRPQNPGWAKELERASGLAGARAAVRYTPDAEAYFRGEDPLAQIRAIPDLLWLDLDRRPSDEDTPFACELVLSALSAAEPEAVAAALRLAGDQAEIAALTPETAPPRSPENRTVRIEAASLDSVSDLLEALIVAKNALAHETAAALGEREAHRVEAAQLALEHATSALHGAVSRMRLAPLRRLFSPLPRQVREMAAAIGKQAELSVSGEDLAVDKSILDGLYEPLIHILRNALDHGLESPKARLAAGKPACGALRLTAKPRGDVAVIEVADDGAGLDLDRIRAVAAARGVLSAEAAAALGEREAGDLVFAPGFSTAREVTDLSGRGVGLDAVRTALARIGGRVEIESRRGQGAVVRMIAPLRTLLARVAVLCVGDSRYGARLDDIREVVRVARENVTTVRTGEAIVVREIVVPLLHLGELLGAERGDAHTLTVALVDSAEGLVGVAVDRIAATVQAPIEAASPLLAGLAGIAGSVLQGDGRVLLVLDLAALAHERSH
jgi:two-component system chemotaxis sensor kinase CheA